MELPTLSVSIGVAVYPESGHTIEQLLGAADRALYQEKR
jgi:GGDEF domain-containing protein